MWQHICMIMTRIKRRLQTNLIKQHHRNYGFLRCKEPDQQSWELYRIIVTALALQLLDQIVYRQWHIYEKQALNILSPNFLQCLSCKSIRKNHVVVLTIHYHTYYNLIRTHYLLLEFPMIHRKEKLWRLVHSHLPFYVCGKHWRDNSVSIVEKVDKCRR